MDFIVTDTDPGCAARCGRLATAHGVVETPAFMPVATQGAVKALSPDQLRAAGARMLLCNAYHLMLRPGAERVAALGGLHRFMGWPGPILTDSGGYQVFSLADLRDVEDAGVRFRSHVDGTEWFLTPERCVEVQHLLGADVIMPLDECVGYPVEKARAARAMERTLSWARRSLEAHARGGPRGQALFGIVQGATFRDLRAECAERLVALGFPGYAIGGVSVGEGPTLLRETVALTAPLLPADRPRYLMGVGLPEDLMDAVAMGVDLFDCVIPTRNGRNGLAFTSAGRVKVRNASHAESDLPLDPACDCVACRTVSRGYLRHLFQAGEILALTLTSLHNVRYYQRLMEEARAAIRRGTFAAFRERVRTAHAPQAPAPPVPAEGGGAAPEFSQETRS